MPQAGTAAARSGITPPVSQRGFFESVDAVLERRPALILTTLVALLFVASLGVALRLPLWLDEIYSLFMVNQPSVVDIVRASYAGCDAQAPLLATIVHGLHRVIPNETLALRLPSIAGFCTMAACVFALARQRLGVAYALLASLISVCSLLYYATEGRCYGLVLGFTSLSLLFWQRAVQRTSRRGALVGLVVSGSFAMAAQYYCVFFLLALFGAELIAAFRARKTDFPLWIATLAPIAVLLPHYPLIRAARPFFAHFWSPASAHSATSFYDTFFAQHAWVLVATVFLYVLAQFAPDPHLESTRGLSAAEWVTYSVLAITPVLVVAFVMFTVKIYVPRYTIWAVPPVALCIVAGLHRATRASRAAPLCGIVAFLALFAIVEAEGLHGTPHLRTGETTRAQLNALPQGDTPIFVANHQIYLENWYYAPASLRRRMFYALDPALDMQYGWPDTGPAVIKVLRHWAPIQAPNLQDFLAAHPHFLVAADGRDWLPAFLLSHHYRLTPLRTDHTFGLESLSVIYDASRS